MAAAAEMGVVIQNTRVTHPPELFPGFNFYIEAFWRLHTCRPQAMSGSAHIPWTAIDRYAERHDMSPTQFYRFVHYIEMMDDAFREYVKSKSGDAGSSDGNNVERTQQEASKAGSGLSRTRWTDQTASG